jgi:hypothetical protein
VRVGLEWGWGRLEGFTNTVNETTKEISD